MQFYATSVESISDISVPWPWLGCGSFTTIRLLVFGMWWPILKDIGPAGVMYVSQDSDKIGDSPVGPARCRAGA